MLNKLIKNIASVLNIECLLKAKDESNLTWFGNRENTIPGQINFNFK